MIGGSPKDNADLVEPKDIMASLQTGSVFEAKTSLTRKLSLPKLSHSRSRNLLD